MKKLLLTIIALATVAAVTRANSKECQSVRLHAVDESDAVDNILFFINSKKKNYIAHEYDSNSHYVYLIYR